MEAHLGPNGGPVRSRHLAFVLLATLFLAATPLWVGYTPEVRGQTSLTILMKDALTFEPGAFTVEPGESVTLTIVNDGALQHTFTLFAQVNADVPVDEFAALQAYYDANTEIVDISLAGGGQQTAPAFDAPMAEGTYTFVCMVAGHAAGGMHGVMTVSSAPPPDGGIDPLLLGIVIAIVVVVIAAAVVVVLRRRG